MVLEPLSAVNNYSVCLMSVLTAKVCQNTMIVVSSMKYCNVAKLQFWERIQGN